MNLVFGAADLSVGEGAFLMACSNHTDDRGYVIASMQQLADEAHMKERAARENKQRLVTRNLLKTAERYHPKNGARIADLYRVNLDLLKQMQRKRTDYGPTLVEELTFDTSENPSSDPPADSAAPPADSAAPPADSAGTPPADSAPLLLPSSSPSPLSGDPSATPDPSDSAEAVTEERESSAAQDHDEGAGHSPASVPEQRTEQTTADSDVVSPVLDGWATGAGLRRPPGSVREQLAVQVAELAAEYPTLEELRAIAEFAGGRRWIDLGRAAMHPECEQRLARVGTRASRSDGRERCPDHPGRYRNGCMDCALAVPA